MGSGEWVIEWGEKNNSECESCEFQFYLGAYWGQETASQIAFEELLPRGGVSIHMIFFSPFFWPENQIHILVKKLLLVTRIIYLS